MDGDVMDEVFRKLQFRDQEKVYILRAPEEFRVHMDAMEDLVRIKKSPNCKQTYDLALFFVRTCDDVEKYAHKAVDRIREDGLLWFAYPKKSSRRYKSDISRDHGWQPLGDLGYEPVRQISIDDDWSALRFRNVENIKTMKRDPKMALSRKGKERSKVE